MAPVDLKQVGKLFNDAIAAIWDDTPDMRPQAVKWLKAARYKLMRDVEEAYYKLERARDKPLLRPAWVVDPTKKLSLFTDTVPAVLDSYKFAMGDNLNNLLKDCGFQSSFGAYSDGIWLEIHFPAQLAAAAAHTVPQALHIDDEFSSLSHTGAFGASDFARLLTDARSDGTDSDGSIQLGARKEETAADSEVPDAVTVPLAARSIVPTKKQSKAPDIADSVAADPKAAPRIQPFPKEKSSWYQKDIYWILGLCGLWGIVVAIVLPFYGADKRMICVSFR
ncbi:hypothetical protein MSAN_00083800 [Mycena sanguinolenta]|uniref:Uncharacterized protein n=1 Tax=Mycena sanguinolenta TaxID=230812 RepID=A0A8H6ZFZ7_9AGAR|nr:hypothetical protein MSAN_00083800 [Mycena sanguinolenta]